MRAVLLIGRTIESPVGELAVGVTERGLRLVEFEGRRAWEIEPGASAILDRACRELDDYFAGRRRTFEVPLDLEGTDFQRRVWDRLRAIPWGRTISYGELAADVGSVARAVGAANGANHVAVIVPCHRVVAADGSLHGYGGGLAAKRWLLDHESAQGSLL